MVWLVLWLVQKSATDCRMRASVGSALATRHQLFRARANGYPLSPSGPGSIGRDLYSRPGWNGPQALPADERRPNRVAEYWKKEFNLISHARAVLGAALVALSLFGTTPLLAQSPSAPSTAPAAQAAAPAAVPAAPGAPAAKKNGESADNPYGLEALWKGSDLVARFVLILLVIMSVGTWYILVVKLLEQVKMTKQARTVEAKFWQAGSVRDAAGSLEKNSAYRFIAEAGVAATTDHGGLKSHIPMDEWIPMSIKAAVDRVHASTQKGLAFLATVGSTSPFVGLFGTVWGIYHALTAIGISGQASIDKVAGPVGEALIMTAIGLAVAIPAVLAYNWLARRNKAIMDEVREFSDELNAVIVGSAGKAA
jgi:biopolymer transport protein ExbB